MWQGLAFVPFALFQLPRLNAERARARVEGPRALAELTPGEPVPDGLDRFAATRFGVHVVPGADGYAILAVNFGVSVTNNSRPPAALERMDTLTTVNLVYALQ